MWTVRKNLKIGSKSPAEYLGELADEAWKAAKNR